MLYWVNGRDNFFLQQEEKEKKRQTKKSAIRCFDQRKERKRLEGRSRKVICVEGKAEGGHRLGNDSQKQTQGKVVHPTM